MDKGQASGSSGKKMEKQDKPAQTSRFHPDGRAWKIAITGILSAFITLILFIGFVIPTGRIGFQVLASFLMVVVFLEGGFKFAFSAWVVTGVLSFFLIADKTLVLAWVGFFGLYPMVKNLIERRIRNRVLETVLKLVWYAICAAAAWGVMTWLLPELLQGGLLPQGGLLLLAIAIGAMIFMLYDELTTRWIHLYFIRISPLLTRRKK